MTLFRSPALRSWHLTASLPDAFYISVNQQYDFLPGQIEEKGLMIVEDISRVLEDVRNKMEGAVL